MVPLSIRCSFFEHEFSVFTIRFMGWTSFFAAPLLALVLATSFATQAAAKETVGSNQLEVGREVAAPP